MPGSSLNILPNIVTPATVVLATITIDAKGRVTAASAAPTTGSGSVVLATGPTIAHPTISDYLELANSTAPGTPTAASRIYIDSSNRFSWKGTNGFVRTFDGTSNTADRVYVLPDKAGTVSLLSDFAAPPAIGNTTPAAITGTIITATTRFVGPILAPSADSTTALKLTKADGTTAVLTVDTTNSRIGIGGTPTGKFHVFNDGNSQGVRVDRAGFTFPSVSLFNGSTLEGSLFYDTSNSYLTLNRGGNTLAGLLVSASDIVETRSGLLLNQASGTSVNVIYVGSTSTGAVNNTFGFMVAGYGTGFLNTNGPYFGARGNAFSAASTQRGNIFLTAGYPTTPVQGEGQIRFISGTPSGST